MLTSLVPYDSLCTVLANLTPVIMYPVIRTPDTLCRKHIARNEHILAARRVLQFSPKMICNHFLTCFILTRLHHLFTFVQLLYIHLQLSLATHPAIRRVPSLRCH